MHKQKILVRHNIKTMKLPNQEFRELVRFVNEGREDKSKKIYEDKEPKKIDWNSYTL